jgi:uncharacterized membrane protein
MRRLAIRLVLLIVITSACHGVDTLFEGPAPLDSRLSVKLASSSITVARGAEQSITASVERIGQYRGNVTVSVEKLPFGVSAVVGTPSTVGEVTTATVSLRVASDAFPGRYEVIVRGRADRLSDAVARLDLAMTEAPSFSLTASQSSLSIIRGGLAPLTLRFARTNLSTPISLAIAGPPGAGATFTPNPVASDSAEATISVASTVPPGAYSLTIRGTASGSLERTVNVALSVPADATQLIVPPDLTVTQGGRVDTRIIINRGTYAGDLTLSAENLPTGVTASFQPSASSETASTLAFTVAPQAAAGSYPITVRAKGAGIPDATAEVRLNISAVTVALALDPSSVSVFQGGANARSVLTIARTGFTGAVTVAVEGSPTGVSVIAELSTISGATTSITTTASATAAPGQYAVTLRATPVGFPPSASQTAVLNVTVRAAPTGAGNVIIDWSTCSAPDWVAFQDGDGPWTEVVPTAGIARVTVSSATGAFAFVEGRSRTSVSYMTQAELTAGPVVLCPPKVPSKAVTGIAAHTSTSPAEQAIYSLGGGAGASTGAAPSFMISGVREGVHDLVGWLQTSASGTRGLLLRDVNLPDGGSLGTVSWVDAGAFSPARAALTFLGFSGDASASHSMTYLTTSVCTPNPLYAGFGGAMLGVPATLQRATDFHLATITAATTGNTRVRTASLSFHTLSDRTIALAAVTATPSVVGRTGSYKRLSATLGDIPGSYNRMMTLEYSDGGKTMKVTASASVAGNAAVTLTMPDFSGVAGWQNEFAPSAAATGTWAVTLDGGSSNGSLCAEDERRVSIQHRGAFQ